MTAIETYYAIHESGTKFYELVTVIDHGSEKGVMVRRYGKINSAEKGGETKIETFNLVSQMADARRALIKAKEKRGYRGALSQGFGSNSVVKDFRLNTSIGDHLARHYGNSEIALTIMAALGAPYIPNDAEGLAFDDVVILEPKSEPVRGTEWA